MWYTVYDSQARVFRSIAQHWKLARSMWSNAYTTPYFPTTARRCEALDESIDRMFKEYPKPEFAIQSIFLDDQTAVGVEETVVAEAPFARLLRFRKILSAPEVNPPQKEASSDCLIVAPLSGHYATLLRDTVKGMLVHCDNVYITDWKNARDVPLSEGIFHLSTYVHTIEAFMDALGRRVHVVAVCQPVVPVLMSASRRHAHPMRPLSITLIGGPVDARQSPTAVNHYATEHGLDWFKQNVIDHVPAGYAGAGRRVYPGFLQHFGFVAMNPQRHAQAHRDFYEHLLQGDNSSAQKHRAFYDEYNAVLDLDAAYYIETIEQVFQTFSLAKGEMVMDGQSIVPGRIRDIALFTIEGEKDDIAGIGQTRAAHGLCTGLPEGMKRHWEVPEVGHYGVFSGSTFRRKIAPEIAAWQQSVVRGVSTDRTVADIVRALPLPTTRLVAEDDGVHTAFHSVESVAKATQEESPLGAVEARPATPEPQGAAFWTAGPSVKALATPSLVGNPSRNPIDNSFVFISIAEDGTSVAEAEKLTRALGGVVVRSMAGNLLVHASASVAQAIALRLVGWKYYPEYKDTRAGPARAPKKTFQPVRVRSKPLSTPSKEGVKGGRA